MESRRSVLRRLKLRTVLVVALLLSGIIPLGISSALLIRQSNTVLRNTERDNLTGEAKSLSLGVNSDLVAFRRQLAQLGEGLLAAPGAGETTALLREEWVQQRLQRFQNGYPEVLALQVLDAEGLGLGSHNLTAAVESAMKSAFAEARAHNTSAYRFVSGGSTRVPQVVVAVPAPVGAKAPKLVVLALREFQPLESVTREEPRQGVGVFLIDRQGKMLWSNGRNTEAEKALLASEVVRSFVKHPMTQTSIYEATTTRGRREIFVQVSDIQESGWGLVLQKPLAEAFADLDRMIFNAALSTALLVALSLFFAYLAARWVSRPIQRLAETTHEIAKGKFGGSVEMEGLTFELADLAEDFNQMSGHVATYVQQLRQAAQANRELFIGSLRAFVAAVDAKDPYTRGHSERVAAFSRTISRYLQLPEETQHRIWIGALLHDVGKIGVEDRILRKDGVLAPDEYEQMKMHTVIGAEIMAPIEQLKEMIPAIRWHHEAWNGRGYPDGLKGEQIPLFARIVAVADTFDAITTNRPYQQAYSLQFAVETITRLTGSRFDAKIVTAFLRAFEAGEIRAGTSRPSRIETTTVEARAAGGHR
jgi:HD-GYP domain-containing protein (c-di-GMP phosphodiesterase class II)